jgi:hypothetical protein
MNLARPVAATKHAMDAVGAGRCPAAPIDNRCAGYQPAPQCKARDTVGKIVAGREEFEVLVIQINTDKFLCFYPCSSVFIRG